MTQWLGGIASTETQSIDKEDLAIINRIKQAVRVGIRESTLAHEVPAGCLTSELIPMVVDLWTVILGGEQWKSLKS